MPRPTNPASGRRPRPAPTTDRPATDLPAADLPPNLAAILFVVRIPLGYGRHLAETFERRAAAPGFHLIAKRFGCCSSAVILAHIHRGILRAAFHNLAAGGVRLEVSRIGTEVVMRPLDPATFAFRAALSRGGTLEAAATAALAADAEFDLAGALGDLFRGGAVTGVALSSPDDEAAS